MKTAIRTVCLAISFLAFACNPSSAATLYVNLQSPSPAAPYASWATAATNIQHAIDAAAPGDLVLVTNGIYATGGKVMFGDLTNRVALDKAITVRSVNGPYFTTIRGNGATNGPLAVRCAWLTNGATLRGFTLTAGATRMSGDVTNTMAGGGVLCLGSDAWLQNCLVISNLAQGIGGGVFRGRVASSAIWGNRSVGAGSAAAYATLLNCTVVSNWQSVATFQSQHTNTILYYNNSGNYGAGILAYCCTQPVAPGTGNIAAPPQFLSDGLHLQSTSPCRGAGIDLGLGTDIDGQAWSQPPSIGCDEWGDEPLIISQPRLQLTNNPISFRITLEAAGPEPLDYYWFRNGVLVTNDEHFSFAQTSSLFATGVSEADAGSYQVVVSNAFGTAVSLPIAFTVRYVNAENPVPVAPFNSWESAATNIQDAIDVAKDGDLILVTNGIYASGGKVMAGDLTNRVALDKAIAVQSVNGPYFTTIRGNGAVNDSSAVRCAWLTNGAILDGFTLTDGATRTAGDNITLRSGGGVWCASSNAVVSNCIIKSNTASAYGSGLFAGQVRNSWVIGNEASPFIGGAIANADVVNCTVVSNQAFGVVQVFSGVSHVTNSIVYYNVQNLSAGLSAQYSCVTPLPSGVGNTATAPLLRADGVSLFPDSPCRGTGTSVASGVDLLGRPWANPPSMGCVEWNPTPIFEKQPVLTFTDNPGGFAVNCTPVGQSPLTFYWYHEGMLLTDDGRLSGTTTTNLVARKIRPDDVGNYWVVVSNAFGVTTSSVARLVLHYVNASSVAPTTPYTNWSSAANTIQAAVDVAQAGAVVLVTNGLYATGERMDDSGLMTRVIVDKPITVLSVNGYKVTTIEGRWDTATNGPNAIRCVRLENGTVLAGFTIQNGATRSTGGSSWSTAGGGVFTSVYTNATVANCLLTNNAARSYGGGAYGVRLKNCLILGNYANDDGSGVACGELVNCTVAYNWVNSFVPGGLMRGGGVAGNVGYLGTAPCRIRNSIVWQNFRGYGEMDNYTTGTEFAFSASVGPSDAAPPGIGNQLAERTFLDADFHISSASIYHAAGSALYASGEDMDGEPWANPPSMGADEVIEANLTGPLTLTIDAWQTNTIAEPIRHELSFGAVVTGRVSRIDWNYGDGGIDPNRGYWGIHGWTNPGTYAVTATAYNQDNPDGVVASVMVLVEPINPPVLQSSLLNANGYNFSFMAQPGMNYYVQYATNLAAPISWQPLQTIYYPPFGPSGLVSITDPAWTNNTARFYRVLAQ